MAVASKSAQGNRGVARALTLGWFGIPRKRRPVKARGFEPEAVGVSSAFTNCPAFPLKQR